MLPPAGRNQDVALDSGPCWQEPGWSPGCWCCPLLPGSSSCENSSCVLRLGAGGELLKTRFSCCEFLSFCSLCWQTDRELTAAALRFGASLKHIYSYNICSLQHFHLEIKIKAFWHLSLYFLCQRQQGLIEATLVSQWSWTKVVLADYTLSVCNPTDGSGSLKS